MTDHVSLPGSAVLVMAALSWLALASPIVADDACAGSGVVVLKPWLTTPQLETDPVSGAGCVVDLWPDGVVGSNDLNTVLGSWSGGEDEGPAAGDIDGDGLAGCFDLDIVLARWGTCPEHDVNGDGDSDHHDLKMIIDHEKRDCRRDLDRDGCVDNADLATFACLEETDHPIADFDGNGVVDVQDEAMIVEALGMDCRGDVNGDGVIGWSDVKVVCKGGCGGGGGASP